MALLRELIKKNMFEEAEQKERQAGMRWGTDGADHVGHIASTEPWAITVGDIDRRRAPYSMSPCAQ